MPFLMPQLSPMFGSLIFLVVLFFYFVLLCSMSKKTPLVMMTKVTISQKLPLFYFK